MKKLYYENVRKYSTRNIFLLTIFLCVILNFFFLRVVLKNGLTGDDWQLLFILISKLFKSYFLAAFIFISVNFVSFNEINRYFNDLLIRGTGSNDQSYMQNQVLSSLDKNQLNLFVYFEGLEKPNLHQYFEYWVLYFKKPNFLGCISCITDRNKLIEAYKDDNGEFFEWDSLCTMS